jgi:hypothetical protein
VVPGQGPAFHDKAYLERTADLYAAVLSQVHSALERGVFTLADIQAAVNVDDIALGYTPGASVVRADFREFLRSLVAKARQEALDGIGK